MSLKTWKEEFYPVKPTKKMSTIEAVKHSIRKWEGLKKFNLKKHDVLLNDWDNRSIEDDSLSTKPFNIDVTSCALCVKFRNEDAEESPCTKCPLFISRGGFACDSDTPKEDELSNKLQRWSAHPFSLWLDDKNPLPMIRDLKKTLKMLERGELE